MADAQLGEGRQFNLHSAGTDLVEGSALAVKGASGAITVDGFTETGASALIALAVGGATPHDSVDSGNPVKVGGHAYSGVPAAVSTTGDRTDAAFTMRGGLHVNLRDSSGSELVTGVSADNIALGLGLNVNAVTLGYDGTNTDMLRTVPALDAAPNTDVGILAVGTGPGWDRKQDPTGIAATSTANAVTVVVDGADAITFQVTTIGTTPGSMIFETQADDSATWQTAGAVIKLSALDSWVEASFVPAVGDVYVVRCNGLRKVRYRVNAVYASGTATVKFTAVTGTPILKAIEMPGAPHKLGYTPVNLSETYTAAQTSQAIKTAPGNAANVVSATQRFVVTHIQIQAYATTGFTCIVYFGTGAFTRSTSRVVFDGEFLPSTTSKPGYAQTFPVNPPIGAADEELRITTVGAGSVTVNVWGYLVAA